MTNGHEVWTAITIIFVLIVVLWVWVLMSNKRTNNRLKAIEKTNRTNAKTQGVVISIQSDVHMIKQYLMDQGGKQ